MATASQLAAQGIQLEDPYAPIRTLPRTWFERQSRGSQMQLTGNSGSGSGEGSNDVYTDVPNAPTYGLTPEGFSNFDGIGGGAFQSKFGDVVDMGENRMAVKYQDPGKHKYDLLNAVYSRPDANSDWALEGDPTAARQASTGETFYRDPLEQFGKDFVLPSAAMYFGGQALMGGVGGAGAGAGATGAGATTAAGTAPGGIGTLGTIAPGSAALAPIGATGMASTAPLITATIPQVAGASTGILGTIAAGAKNMGASDWIQLAGLGASLYQADKTQDAAEGAAEDVTQNAKDMLEFSKAQYADSLPFIKAAQEKSLQVSDAQLASMKQQDELSKEYADYNRTTFRPLEQGIVASAQDYDTPEKRQSAADQALADVNMQFNARNAATARQLAASGVTPGSAKSMAVLGSQGVEQARVGAGAAQQARKGVETTGIGLRADAANMGRNLPSAQATSAGLGIQAGNSAVNNSVTGANASTGQAGQVLNTMNATGNMNLAAGRLQQNAQDAQTQLWGQLGQTAGRYFTSDVNMKEDIQPADAEQALQQVTSTPVSNWKYSPAKMAAKGLDADGEQHTGAMAQDVNATMGEQAAPGGKKIDLVSMNGKTMLAVQALDRKINTLAKMLAGGKLQAGMAA